MIVRRIPVTLEQRQRRQRFLQHVRQLSLLVALALAFLVGTLLSKQP